MSRNNRLLASIALILLWSPAIMPGQTRVVAKGHTVPQLPTTAQGEVVTLFVRGLAVPAATATQLPLPTELSGVSVTAHDVSGIVDTRLPIFSVRPLSCAGGLPIPCGLTAVSVQMPTDMPQCLPLGNPLPQRCVSRFTVTVGAAGTTAEGTDFLVAGSEIRVLNSCDVTLGGFFQPPPELLGLCFSLVTKADGTVVSGVNPARPGEALVLYAVGLGLTSKEAALGHPSPPGLSFPPEQFYVRFDTRLGTPRPPLPNQWFDVARPDYVGLVAGAVGLYQANITVPENFSEPLSPCAGFVGSTNLTLTFGTAESSDTASICVEDNY